MYLVIDRTFACWTVSELTDVLRQQSNNGDLLVIQHDVDVHYPDGRFMILDEYSWAVPLEES